VIITILNFIKDTAIYMSNPYTIFLGTKSLFVLMCRKAVNRSIDRLTIIFQRSLSCATYCMVCDIVVPQLLKPASYGVMVPGWHHRCHGVAHGRGDVIIIPPVRRDDVTALF